MKFDLQDALLLLGVSSLTGGVAVVYWPGALMLFGLMCFLGVFLIERTRTKLNGPANK